MLLAWVPRPWAIFGALLVAARLGAGSYWNESYWGGSIAAIGGALLLGAARRLWRRDPRRRRRAAGRSVSRSSSAAGPTRARCWRLPVGVLLLFGLATRRLRPAPWIRLVFPVVLLIGATLGAVAVHNRAITGDPLEFPHRLYDRMHAIPLFLWEPLGERLGGERRAAAGLRTGHAGVIGVASGRRRSVLLSRTPWRCRPDRHSRRVPESLVALRRLGLPCSRCRSLLDLSVVASLLRARPGGSCSFRPSRAIG